MMTIHTIMLKTHLPLVSEPSFRSLVGWNGGQLPARPAFSPGPARLTSSRCPSGVENMTSQGTAHGRFQRAIRRRHLLAAEMAARELGVLSLADALKFCLLLADMESGERFSRAIARWHARFVLDAVGITADQAALALSAAEELAGPIRELAAETLRQLATQYRLDAVARVLDRDR